MSNDYKNFLKDSATPTSLRCAVHDSTYSPGGSCYFCRTGYTREDIDYNTFTPKASAERRLAKARNSDPETSHEGVARISAGVSENRRKIQAIEFPPHGLNYREIAEAAGIYPTTCSRVITTMYRQGDLRRIGKDSGGYRYIPETAFS